MAVPAPTSGWRDRARLVAIGLSAIVTLVGTFSPWLRSGSSRRSSYDLLSLVERIGFTPGGVVEWAVRLWPLVAVLIVGSVVASWWRRPWVSAVCGIGAGVYAAWIAVAVSRAPELGPISVEWGPSVTVLGAIGMIGTAIWTIVDRPRRSLEPGVALDEHVA